jgi:predicted XRE-type DNA-binding protein
VSKSTINGADDFDDWISQAEAGRIRGVSKQAIAKLVKRQRLAGREIGGRLLVLRSEVEAFIPMPIGRPRSSAIPKKAPSKKKAAVKKTKS